ncbi:MAG: chemotaxis protein CheX [Lachnospiraceae bacterium]|nr:chemotaxis protein CheX [Lachnospiraceae bacterium]
MKQGLDVNHINPFLQSAVTIFESMAQMKLGIGKPSVASLKFDEQIFALQVGLTGDLKGQIFLVMNIEDAKTVASKMMCGMPVNELDDMAASALAELSNMVMGNTATLFSNKNIRIDITPPISMRGAQMQITSDVQALRIPLLYEGKECIGMYLCVTAE